MEYFGGELGGGVRGVGSLWVRGDWDETVDSLSFPGASGHGTEVGLWALETRGGGLPLEELTAPWGERRAKAPGASWLWGQRYHGQSSLWLMGQRYLSQQRL